MRSRTTAHKRDGRLCSGERAASSACYLGRAASPLFLGTISSCNKTSPRKRRDPPTPTTIISLPRTPRDSGLFLAAPGGGATRTRGSSTAVRERSHPINKPVAAHPSRPTPTQWAAPSSSLRFDQTAVREIDRRDGRKMSDHNFSSSEDVQIALPCPVKKNRKALPCPEYKTMLDCSLHHEPHRTSARRTGAAFTRATYVDYNVAADAEPKLVRGRVAMERTRCMRATGPWPQTEEKIS